MTKKIGKYVLRTNQPSVDIFENLPGKGFPYDGSQIQLKNIIFDESNCCPGTIDEKIFCPPTRHTPHSHTPTKDGSRWSQIQSNLMLFVFATPNNINGRGPYSGLEFKYTETHTDQEIWTAYSISSDKYVNLLINYVHDPTNFIDPYLNPGGWYFSWLSNDNDAVMYLYNSSTTFTLSGWKVLFRPSNNLQKPYTSECIEKINDAIVEFQLCGTTYADCPPLSSPSNSPPTPVPHHAPSSHAPSSHAPSSHTPSSHTPSSHTPSPGPSPQKHGLSTGLIVGIVVGILLLLFSSILFVKFR